MEEQGELFGPGELPRVAPAPVEEAVRELAGRLPARLRLGTSSWSFPGWAGLVWARRRPAAELARHGLAAYARHPLLRAVGLDRTFYAPLPAAAFAAYADQAPQDFRFLVKAWSVCTTPAGARGADGAPADGRRFLDPAFAAEEVVGPAVEGLGARLGALLFQFPPAPRGVGPDGPRFAEALYRFLETLGRRTPLAVEIRRRDWLTRGFGEALAATGAVPALVVHPRMPGLATQLDRTAAALGGPLVVRWMLGGRQGYDQARERYAPFDRLVDEDAGVRGAVADLCAEATADGREALVVINNKAEGSAPLSVQRLAEAVAARCGARTARAGGTGGVPATRPDARSPASRPESGS